MGPLVSINLVMTETPHVGDVGDIMSFTCLDSTGVVYDISGFTTRDIIFQRPDGTMFTVIGSDDGNNGTDGVIQYTTVAGDFDQYGYWSAQAELLGSSTSKLSDVVRFKVYPNLPY